MGCSRILLTIPHFYQRTPDGRHGSSVSNPQSRIQSLSACITSLHQSLGRRQGLIDGPSSCIRPTGEVEAHDLDIVVCTTGGHHLLDHLRIPAELYRHQPTDSQPRLLGFACHVVLRDALGSYDHYGYLEDDIAVLDPLFLAKLRWFHRWAGNDCVLQPNRYEVAPTLPLLKLYGDGNLMNPAISPRYQNIQDRPLLRAEFLDTTFTFQRVDNPHSGCFFLNAEQMALWARQPYFLDLDVGFWGPLESAATLGIIRTFRTYKPARECAGFLEVRHLDTRVLQRLPKLTPTDDGTLLY